MTTINTDAQVRTTDIRTLDDLHESNLQELVQYAADNPAAVPGVFVGGGFPADMLVARRQSVEHFDRVTAALVIGAILRIQHTSPRKLRKCAEDVAIVLDFAAAVIQKIDSEDRIAGLEQFGPIKRAVNEALRWAE